MVRLTNFLFLLSFSAMACYESMEFELREDIKCPHKTSYEEIMQFVDKITRTHFPQLAKAVKNDQLKVKFYDDDQYFFKTMFRITHLFKKQGRRKLILKVNERLYNCSPPPKALEAILVHELLHIQDYHRGKTGKLIGLGAKMLGKKSIAKYERATDLRAMVLGHSQGLIEYRNWIYGILKSKKDLEKKKFRYYTPEEIKAWQKENSD